MKRENALSWMREQLNQITGIPQEEIQEEQLLMQDLELSSVEIMQVVAAMEKESQTEVPARMIRKFIRVRDMVDYLENASV